MNNDGNTRNDRPPYQGRNIFEAPGITTVDLRVSRDVPLYRERAKLRLIAEAFNIANHPNFASLNPSVSAVLTTQYNFNSATRVFTPVPTFLSPTDTLDPRILQFAAKITF